MWSKITSKFQINDLKTVYKPISVFGPFSSVGPYDISYKQGKFTTGLNIYYLLYGYILVFMYTICSYVAIAENIYVVKLFGSSSQVLALTERIKFFINVADMLVFSVMIYYKADTLGKVFTRVYEAEVALKKLSMKLDHRKMFFYNLFLLSAVQTANFAIIYFLYYFSFGKDGWKGMVAIFYMYFPGYVTSMAMILFMTIMNQVVQLLQSISEGLQANCDPDVLATFLPCRYNNNKPQFSLLTLLGCLLTILTFRKC